MVCSGAANMPWIFTFSGVNDRLRVFFGLDGGDAVVGTAYVTTRGEGGKPDFEGPVTLTGTRNKDGRYYKLVGEAPGNTFRMELVYRGTGTVWRTADGQKPLRYEAHCQVEAPTPN